MNMKLKIPALFDLSNKRRSVVRFVLSITLPLARELSVLIRCEMGKGWVCGTCLDIVVKRIPAPAEN
jgi:hypothetical protein